MFVGGNSSGPNKSETEIITDKIKKIITRKEIVFIYIEVNSDHYHYCNNKIMFSKAQGETVAFLHYLVFHY